MKAISTNCHAERNKSRAQRVIRGVEGALRLLAQFVAKLFTIGPLLTATLREIFDESAYERFLKRRNLQVSIATYADFCSEHERIKFRRPRCC